MARVAFCVLALIISVSDNEAARILAVFPTPSISHQVVFRPLVHELARRGHEVTVITTDPVFPKGGAPENLTEIDVHDLSYNNWAAFVEMSTGNQDDLKSQLMIGYRLIGDIFGYQMETKEVQHVLKNQKFDLLMLEALARPALALSHVYKVPVIQVSSFGASFRNYEVIGAPIHPILYPSIFRQKVHNLTLWEKLSELYNHYDLNNFYDSFEERENEMVKRIFGEDTPSLSELNNNVDMLFLNMHPIWEGNRPVPPNVIYMGGLHQKPVKELPKELKSYLDASTNGVIYISFGTNVNPSQLPAEKIQVLAKVFSKLPYNVLWKWDKDVLPGQAKNIRIAKWLPQSDLLRHPNVKLFITQGGLQSTDEAITAGVPLIGVPMLGDQWFNVEMYKYHKIGMRLDMKTLSEEKLEEAIETVIEDKSYRQNIKRLSVLMRDQPMPPLDRAVWWTEHVIRHSGARHLRSPSANMPWQEYYELDLVLGVVVFLAFSVAIGGYGILALYWFVRKNYMLDVKLKAS